jgi:hypothetical protein
MDPTHAVAVLFGLPMLIAVILYALDWAARTISDVLRG